MSRGQDGGRPGAQRALPFLRSICHPCGKAWRAGEFHGFSWHDATLCLSAGFNWTELGKPRLMILGCSPGHRPCSPGSFSKTSLPLTTLVNRLLRIQLSGKLREVVTRGWNHMLTMFGGWQVFVRCCSVHWQRTEAEVTRHSITLLRARVQPLTHM